MDGRYPPYPRYKPSGVEWLGEIPSHWDVRRLKFVARFAYGDSLSAVNREEGTVPVFGSNGIVGMHNQANTLAPCIVIGRKGSFGKVNYSDTPVFAIDTTFYVDRRCTKQDLRWLYYALGLLGLDESSQDSAVPGLSREFAYNQAVPFPDLAEQRAIAEYLDRETARIDALIAHKRDLLALLERQRAALISHAVTKGLNPAAPRKDSGIPWLREIPSHWNPHRLKFALARNDGGVWGEDIEDETEGVIVLRSTEIRLDGAWDLSNPARRRLSKQEIEKSLLRTGDLLITKSSGSEQHLGKAAIVTKEIESVQCAFSNFMQRLRVSSQHDPKFLFYLLNCDVGKEQLGYLGSTTTGLRNLNATIFGEIFIPGAPTEEQRAIAEYLDRETARIDRLKGEIEASIDLLGRYRAALISAAVTGKIDVRGALSW